MEAIWLALVVSCAWMAAISAYVGAIHYPTFLEIAEEGWLDFHAKHCARTGFCVVIPIGAHTVAMGLALALDANNWTVWASLISWVFSVGWTFVVSMPLHQKLSVGRNDTWIHKLVTTNHVRTVAWLAGAALGCAGLLT